MSGNDGINFSEKLARDVKTATGLVLGNRGNETVQAFSRTNVRQTRFYKAPGGGIAAPSNSTTPSSATCTLMKWNAAGTALEVTNTTETVYSFSAYAADEVFQAKQVGGKIFADPVGVESSPIAIASIYPVTTTTDSDLEYTRLPFKMQYTKVDGSHNPSAITSSSVSEYYANNPDDFSVSINGTAARFIILQPGTYRGVITFYQEFIRAGLVSHQVPESISIKQVTDNSSNTINVAEVISLKNVWTFPELQIEHRLMLTGLGNSMYRDGQFASVSINIKKFPYTTADGGVIEESYSVDMPFCFSVAAESFSNNVFSPFEMQLWLKRPALYNGAIIRTFSNAFYSGTSWMVRSTELLEYLPSIIDNGSGGVQPLG